MSSGMFRLGVSHVRPGSVPVSTFDVRRLRRPSAVSTVLYAPGQPAVLQVPTNDACQFSPTPDAGAGLSDAGVPVRYKFEGHAWSW